MATKETQTEELAEQLGLNGAKLPANVQIQRADPAETELSEADKPTESPEEFITSLDSSEPIFEAEGDCTIRLGTKVLKLRLRSVPVDFVQEKLNEPRPEAPKRRYPKKGGGFITDEAQLLELDEGFRRAVRRYQNDISWAILFHGTIGIYDAQGQVQPFVLKHRGKVVWGDSVQDYKQARVALEAMRITSVQFAKWLDAIARLGGTVQEEDDDRAFLTDSAGSSGYL